MSAFGTKRTSRQAQPTSAFAGKAGIALTKMEGTAFILVRSVVANADNRKAFDHWYHTDHIPLIFSKVANVNRAWRFWSKSDPAVHYSLGEFSSMSELQQAASSDGFKYVVADYDRAWGTRVTRTRDVLEKVQQFSR